MTTDFHTAHSYGAPLTSAEVNSPLAALDTAIGNLATGVYNVKEYGALGSPTDDTTADQGPR